jgi:radical SAM protein with 4Fe4S-binding SPASM domain
MALRTAAGFTVRQSSDQPQQSDIVAALIADGYGRYFTEPVLLQPYVAAASLGRGGFNDEPATIRTVYVQVRASCQRDCTACKQGVIIWQGCNGCALWPGVEADSQLTPRQCIEIATELVELQARSVFFSGGDPIAQADLVLPMINALRDASQTMNIVVTSRADRITKALVSDLRRTRTKVNCVVSPENPNLRTELENVCALVRMCKSAGVPCYGTVQTIAEPAETAALKSQLLAIGCDRVLQCHSTSNARTTNGVPGFQNSGLSRLKPPNASEMALRLRYSPCSGIMAIAADGSIRPCPMIPDAIGDVQNRGIHKLFANSAQKTFWGMTKDHISGCSDCEYRYACVDCLALDLCASNSRQGVSMCGYDPRTSKWDTEVAAEH